MITLNDIIYRDDSIVVVNKPCNLLVHRSEIDRHETANLVQQVRELVGNMVYPAHRLDKPTSGVILFALSKSNLVALREQFENLSIKKHYHAIVRGHAQEELLIDHPLKQKKVFKTQKEDELKTQEAKTYLSLINSFTIPFAVDKYSSSRYSLVELIPLTGRRHQLRRHMKHLSHPIIGDTSYGKTTHNQFFRDVLDCHRLLLHARSIEFIHPETKQSMRLSADYDAEFKNVANKLNELTNG
ncbi:MAG: pseudouridylate synthase [Gammaproteobacteria bacterium]|nr:pseudouridylate synthase [Gammaproteobacteria bacterium]